MADLTQRLQVLLDEHQAMALRRVAAEQGCSVGELVRRSIGALLEPRSSVRGRAALKRIADRAYVTPAAP